MTIFLLSFSVLNIVSLFTGVVEVFIAFSKLEITYIIQKRMVNRGHIVAYREKKSPFISHKATLEPRLQEHSRTKELQIKNLNLKEL